MVQGSHATGQSPHVVIAAFDFSDAGNLVLEEGFALAVRAPDTELYPTHVAAPYGPLLRLELPGGTETLDAQRAEACVTSYVEERRQSLAHPPVPERVQPRLRAGGPADEIVLLASELGADLVLVGTRARHGMRHLFLGSVSEAVVRRCCCPVLVVRPKGY
jgi:nucleotide-binding universal stress UspA family protein